MSNLRLGYNMRIYRPGIWYLNPYLNDSNPTNITQGNPNLDSEKSHAFNLSYSILRRSSMSTYRSAIRLPTTASSKSPK